MLEETEELESPKVGSIYASDRPTTAEFSSIP